MKKLDPANCQLDGDYETHLIERAVSGDGAAFTILADHYRPGLTVVARRYLRNSDDTNDVVQETLYKAFRSIQEFRVGRPFRPWLFRICSNCCVDSVRLKRREPAGLENNEFIPAIEVPIEDQVGGSILRNQIMEAVGRLPARYRNIIWMRHVRQMEVSEIASELKTPEGTIKSWLFRARAQLRRDLRPAFS